VTLILCRKDVVCGSGDGSRTRGTPNYRRPAASVAERRSAATARRCTRTDGRRMEVSGSAERVVRLWSTAHITLHRRQVDVRDCGPGAQKSVRYVVNIASGLHRAERGLTSGQDAGRCLAARAGRVVRRDQVRFGRRVWRARVSAPSAWPAQQPARAGTQLGAGHAQRAREARLVPQPFAHHSQQFVQGIILKYFVYVYCMGYSNNTLGKLKFSCFRIRPY